MDQLDYEYLSELVVQTQAGSSDAFAELYAATYQKQYRFCYKYLRDEYLAQDALQEVYILALKNIYNLQNPRLFVSWLNQINSRVCFDMTQKQKRHAVELGASDYEKEQVIEEGGNPEKDVSQEDERAYIIKKIRELPEVEGQVIMMKYYQNMKLEEIATALDCNRSTVKRHLAKGRDHLQLLLEDL